MSRSAIMDRIDALLSGVSDPTFTEVMRGEPLGIAGTPCVAFWVTSRDVSFKTLTGVTSNCNFTIRAYFRMQSSKILENQQN
jgi:cobalamin synthase